MSCRNRAPRREPGCGRPIRAAERIAQMGADIEAGPVIGRRRRRRRLGRQHTRQVGGIGGSHNRDQTDAGCAKPRGQVPSLPAQPQRTRQPTRLCCHRADDNSVTATNGRMTTPAGVADAFAAGRALDISSSRRLILYPLPYIPYPLPYWRKTVNRVPHQTRKTKAAQSNPPHPWPDRSGRARARGRTGLRHGIASDRGRARRHERA